VSSDELVTVMIPARDEERFIGRCLDAVRKQDYVNLQIVVVDGASTDGTLEVVEDQMAADDRIELVHNPLHSIPISLNLGLAAARGRWLVRIDAHSTVDESYVRLAVDRLEQGLWGGVGGRKDGVGETAAGLAIAAALHSRFGVGNSVYHHGVTAQEVDHVPFGAYPAELVRELGGWNEQLPVNEDYEFDYRVRQAGHRLLFDPALRIRWRSRQSIPGVFAQYRRYGRGKVDVALLHPDSMRPRHFVPPALVAYLAGTVLISWRHPRRLLLLNTPYLLGLAAASVQTARRLETPAERAYVPLAFSAMHIGWGLGFWSAVRSAVAKRLLHR
jgi:glycosyltransferase involved in cell wall biosynthesis